MLPQTELQIVNAAIGATSSDYAVFRAERDIIQHHCDLVFVEYAVNDLTLPPAVRDRAREGLLRKLVRDGNTDVVLIYTHAPEMIPDLQRACVPESIASFEALARDYQISSIWVGLYVWEKMKQGCVHYEQWLPDGLHPQAYGSRLYAEPVCAFLQDELDEPHGAGAEIRRICAPSQSGCWDRAHFLPWSQVHTHGAWHRFQSHSWVWADQILHTHADGAELTFSFDGTALEIFQDFGWNAAEYLLWVDAREPVRVNFTPEDWCGDSGWIRGYTVDGLAQGEHRVKLMARHCARAGKTGMRLDLLAIGIVP